MTSPVQLLPMFCVHCQAPIPAQPEEVAWVCQQCGQAQLLSDEKGLQPLEVRFAADIPQGAKGKPFWVAEGSVSLQRQTYRGDQTREMETFWQRSHRFFVPAYTMPFDQSVELGVRLLRQPPTLQPGSPSSFLPVTVLPEDMQSLAEFIVLSIEAERKDDLRELRFKLDLQPAELWVLP